MNISVLLHLYVSQQPLPFYSYGSKSILQVKEVYTVDVWISGWMQNSKRPDGLKNEHAILLQVQCIHTVSLFWHTHQAQRHPTHQLSSHAKFTQCADRQTNTRLCCVCSRIHVCVSTCLCESRGCGSVVVCTVCQSVCLRGCVLLDCKC